ncbi:hypothetical protein AJ78_01193 [Emergomyces pasteurianus Ep9510]|uniref:RecA family profile 1 domain-containing protein n=1 Tax=Emergomyces pasteurianus Ep9510 TaxID=1447872 RepID=A0A1J9PS96_9EURO|nr:hypothetical protein AJ78_01193 [Emergomyces pasteurianus Ep9510]
MTQEEDVAKFSSPDEARLKRRSEGAFGAFGSVKLSEPSNPERDYAVSTGLPRLDAALAMPPGVKPSPLGPGRNNIRIQCHSNASRGIQRGEVTEIMGPRGVGKTVFAMGLAARVLQTKQQVVWIDTASPMNPTRFKDILQGDIRATSISGNPPDAAPGGNNIGDFLNHLLYFHPPTLAHLLALISHPPKGFPPQETGLIVIDPISSLFTSEYRTKLPPRNRKSKLTTATESKDERTRWKVIGNLVMNLKKLAAKFNCVVIVINEMVSRFREKQPPVLHEALSGITWDSGVTTRIVLCWHWLPPSFRSRVRMKRVRFAEVVKAEKAELVLGRTQRIVPFVIKKTGVHEFTSPLCGTPISITIRTFNRSHLVHLHTKRKLSHVMSFGPNTRRKPRVELTAGAENKIERNHPDEGTSGTILSQFSLALPVKEEEVVEEEEEGDEYRLLDEGGTEFVHEEVVSEEDTGGDDSVGPHDCSSEDSPSPSHTEGGYIEDDAVLLLQNIADDDEFD